jgi:hypothetical protein
LDDPAEKTKMRKEHHVPLSRQMLAILQDLRTLTGPSGHVFPSVRTRLRPMSENTMNAGLRRGWRDEMTAHGFRAMASTLLNESGKWNPDAIERALAHGEPDKVRGSYHRGKHWEERVAMAQWWSDYLDRLRDGAKSCRFHPPGWLNHDSAPAPQVEISRASYFIGVPGVPVFQGDFCGFAGTPLFERCSTVFPNIVVN